MCSGLDGRLQGLQYWFDRTKRGCGKKKRGCSRFPVQVILLQRTCLPRWKRILSLNQSATGMWSWFPKTICKEGATFWCESMRRSVLYPGVQWQYNLAYPFTTGACKDSLYVLEHVPKKHIVAHWQHLTAVRAFQFGVSCIACFVLSCARWQVWVGGGKLKVIRADPAALCPSLTFSGFCLWSNIRDSANWALVKLPRHALSTVACGAQILG